MSAEDPAHAAAPQAEPQPSPSGTEDLAFHKSAYAEPVATKVCVACQQTPCDAWKLDRRVVVTGPHKLAPNTVTSPTGTTPP